MQKITEEIEDCKNTRNQQNLTENYIIDSTQRQQNIHMEILQDRSHARSQDGSHITSLKKFKRVEII